MKSTILSIVPLVGFALAQKGCNRPIVTKTETEKVYVTVQPSSSLPDITITSTIDITTTITVRPSTSVEASTTGLHWGSYPNGTWSNHTGRPQPIHSTVSLDYTPSPITETPAPTNVPSETPYPSGDYYEYSESSEAPVPTSEAPVPTSEAPAAPQTSPVDADAGTASTSAAGSKRGEATFYGGNTNGGTCSFTGYTIPSSLFGTAASGASWNSAANCGACVSVTGPSGNKITAMIVDQCPECAENNLDLFQNGFSKLADISKGIVPISWDFVPCGITSPIVLKNKSGTSAHWFSMQVQNSNIAVASLEVSTDGGKTWKKTQRQPYNYFENASGFGTQSVDVKVTSTNGKSIIVKNVSVAPETTKTASSNFS